MMEDQDGIVFKPEHTLPIFDPPNNTADAAERIASLERQVAELADSLNTTIGIVKLLILQLKSLQNGTATPGTPKFDLKTGLFSAPGPITTATGGEGNTSPTSVLA